MLRLARRVLEHSAERVVLLVLALASLPPLAREVLEAESEMLRAERKPLLVQIPTSAPLATAAASAAAGPEPVRGAGNVPGYQSTGTGPAVGGGGEKSEEESKNSTLIVAFVLMLIFQLGNRIFGRLVTFPMHNYPLFMNMLSVSIYIPICFAYIFPVTMWTTMISKEQQAIPKYKFAVMGAYDSLAGIMQTFAVNYISNASTIVLVQQSAIPISMAISKYALDAKYTTAQYVGSSIVLLGIFIVLCPTLLSSSSSSSSSSSPDGSDAAASGGGGEGQQLMWIFILVVSCVPMCMSSVYKEKALGEVDIDVVFLNGWVAIYQFLIALPLCIPSAQVINIPVSEILPNLWGGLLCWMGINSVTFSRPGLEHLWLDDCSTAPFYVSTYLLFNVVFNILIVVILKHGSANIMWMASTVIVPLSNVAFSLDWMPGHKPLNTFDVIGLFVIMMGLVQYRFSAQLATLWNRVVGNTAQLAADEEEEKRVKLVGRKAEQKQARYLGLNQIEAVEGVFDSRVTRDQTAALFRSPQQIRGNFLLSLGIPPSPHVQHLLAAEESLQNVQLQPLSKTSKMPSFIEMNKGLRANSFVSKSYLQGNMMGRGPGLAGPGGKTTASMSDLESLLPASSLAPRPASQQKEDVVGLDIA